MGMVTRSGKLMLSVTDWQNSYITWLVLFKISMMFELCHYNLLVKRLTPTCCLIDEIK